MADIPGDLDLPCFRTVGIDFALPRPTLPKTEYHTVAGFPMGRLAE